jgi:Carboxypeptidase regulatory-like domain
MSRASVRRTVALAIVVGILTLAPVAASAQETGVLRGVFLDSSVDPFIPIEGATVFVTGPATQTTTTDATGSFSMVLPEGIYLVIMTAKGYNWCGIPDLGVLAGQDTGISCALRPLDVHHSTYDTRGHGTAITNRLGDIEAQIIAGDVEGALDSLRSLRRKADGCPDRTGFSPEADDWVVNCLDQIPFRAIFDILIASLGG